MSIWFSLKLWTIQSIQLIKESNVANKSNYSNQSKYIISNSVEREREREREREIEIVEKVEYRKSNVRNKLYMMTVFLDATDSF
jgi:hypothetical protein